MSATPEVWGFWDWLAFLLLLGVLTGWLCYLVDVVDRWLARHFPRRCVLCHKDARRPGDELCLYCTQLLRRPPGSPYLDDPYQWVRRG